MKIEIVSAGQTPPAWVREGMRDYQKRLPSAYHFTLTEIPRPKRSKTQTAAQNRAQEAAAILARITDSSFVIALTIDGSSWSTEQLAEKLAAWRTHHSAICFIIGGPDGLAEPVLKRANEHWSLSNLTFPHMLVRVILTEQLYRAHCILTGHPYHR